MLDFVGYPLMVLLEFNRIKDAQAWVDKQDKKQLAEKMIDIRTIRKYQKMYGSC